MNAENSVSFFYRNMGILLLGLIILGFGSMAIVGGRSPLESPLLFHIHGVTYLVWFALYITQANLIPQQNYARHKQLGYASLVVIPAMIITGMLMAGVSYGRGESPIPDTTIQQFMAFPISDLFGIAIFFTIAFLNRSVPLTHKHAMLMLCIAIMDPAVARLAIVAGVPPAAVLLHAALVGIVMFHDRKAHSKIHWVTWLGLVYVISRPVLMFTVGASEGWANLMDGIYS